MNTKNYHDILHQLEPHDTTLVAVSKRQPIEKLRSLYEAGHRDFGENRVQEFLEKKPLLPTDIRWHLIGHLQTNKVKDVIGHSYLIHSVDRLKLARKLNDESDKIDCQTSILLQIKIAEETSKFGYDFDQLIAELNSNEYAFDHLRIEGVMGMATFTEDKQQIRNEFSKLKSFFDRLKTDYFSDQEHFKHISMGMSGDYTIALDEGSTMVRIGSGIFGART